MDTEQIKATLATLQQAMCPSRPTVTTSDCTCDACKKGGKR